MASSTWTGTRPFLRAFPRKMSAKAVLTTASKPPAWSAHTACSREEPQPKFRPATRTRAPSASGRFRAKPGVALPSFSHRQSAKSAFPRPSRVVVTRKRAGMIWSVSTFSTGSTTVRERISRMAFIGPQPGTRPGRRVAEGRRLGRRPE